MKKVLIFILVLCYISGNSQTIIQPCTPVSTISTLPFGSYLFISGTDSVTLNIVSAVPVCPICKVYTAADTLAIQNLKICPVCPICPVIPPQRTATSLTWDAINKRWIIGYSDNSVSYL